MRKSRRLAAALLLCLTLCACGAAQKPQTPYRMVLITKSTTTQFWVSAIAGASAAKAEYNVELSIVGPETEEDYEFQNRYIRQAVQDGADAIIFSAISYSENAAAIDEAAAAGVRIVVIDSDVDSAGVSARIGTDNIEAGRMAAEELGLGDSVRVIGFDTNVACVDLLRSGAMSALIVQNPYTMGYLGVETAWKLLEGKSVDAVLDTSTAIVTRDNMFTAEGQQHQHHPGARRSGGDVHGRARGDHPCPCGCEGLQGRRCHLSV